MSIDILPISQSNLTVMKFTVARPFILKNNVGT